MARILLMISLAAASLAAKDRAWQNGNLLDNSLNPYFRTVAAGNGGSGKPSSGPLVYDTVTVEVNANRSGGDVVYDDYVIEGEDTVYMVETTRFKGSKTPHLSLSLPLNYAVEKNKLWIKDLDRNEYEAQILKQVPKGSSKPGTLVAAVETKPAPEKPKPAPEKPPVKQEAAPAKATPKPDTFALTSVQTPKPATPKPVPATPVADSKPVVSKPAPAAPVADPKPAPKVEAVVSKPPVKPAAPVAKVDPKPQKPEPAPKVEAAAKPESGASAHAATKDRAWQSGQLLSIVNNSYFFNVTYSSDSEGSAWPFVQGSDGRYTVNGQVGNPTSSLYTYDNYLIESQFVVYLVQRMRPKTSAAVRFPGTKALKFAVEKNKMWVLDDENIEYETKVVKLIQKDAIVDPLTRAAAR